MFPPHPPPSLSLSLSPPPLPSYFSIICTISLAYTQVTLDSGNPSIPSDSNVHDVACLLKQYLRELPKPLITSHLLPVFEACYSLLPQADRQRCMLLACLLLPQMHLQVCHRSTTCCCHLVPKHGPGGRSCHPLYLVLLYVENGPGYKATTPYT